MARYRLTVEYEGTRYSGWQVQKGARTIQGALIEAARKAFGSVGELMGAGRTDAGVHALAQSVHVDLPSPLTETSIQFGFNDNLPADINVTSVRPAQGRFHARHDATGRSYIYQISRRRTAFGKPYVWWVKDRLDVGTMRRSTVALIGHHDFRSFSDQTPGEGSTLVVVDSLDIAEFDDLIVVRVCASHFLRKMVRRLVGTLVEIGRGALDVDTLNRALEDPGAFGFKGTAPPSGLFLEAVAYRGETLPRVTVPALRIGA